MIKGVCVGNGNESGADENPLRLSEVIGAVKKEKSAPLNIYCNLIFKFLNLNFSS